MLDSLSSKAILAKVKAMQGRMLTAADYEQLMHRSSVPACAAYLKAHPAYADALRDVQETQIHRGALEALLSKTVFEQYLRLSRYAGRNDEFFRSYQMAWVEIRCIFNRVRLMENAAGLPQSDAENEFLQSIPGYLVNSLSFNVLALANVHTFDELLAALKRTPYGKVLEKVRPTPESGLSLTNVEHALYLFYYENVHKLVDRYFRGSTARELHEIFTAQAQLYNLSIAYRLKRTFGASPQEIRQLMLPGEGRLSRQLMRRMIDAPDDAAMLDVLSHSCYAPFFDRENFTSIEFGVNSIRYRLSKRHLTFSQHPATVFVAFLTLREQEIENLTNIIEGVRYGLDASQIRPLLIQNTASSSQDTRA